MSRNINYGGNSVLAAYKTVDLMVRVRFPLAALTLEKLGSKGALCSGSRSNPSDVFFENMDSTLLSPSQCRANGSALTLENGESKGGISQKDLYILMNAGELK